MTQAGHHDDETDRSVELRALSEQARNRAASLKEQAAELLVTAAEIREFARGLREITLSKRSRLVGRILSRSGAADPGGTPAQR